MFPWKYLHNKVNATFKQFPTEEDYRQSAKSENNLVFATLAVANARVHHQRGGQRIYIDGHWLRAHIVASTILVT